MDRYFFSKNLVVISRYYYNLAKSLIAKKDIDFKIVSSLFKNNYLKDLNKNYKKGLYFPRYPDLKIIKELFRISNKLYISKIKPNILHDTYYSDKIDDYKILKVITVYDLIHEKFPNLYGDIKNKKIFRKLRSYNMYIRDNKKRFN